MLTLEKAIVFATKAHEGQKDQSGLPYILHCLHVMMEMKEDSERIVAVLHDVTEDTHYTLVALTELGITQDMHHALHLLDKNNSEDYDVMITQIKSHPIARKVKVADLEHNMKLQRTLGRSNMTERDKERIAKYYKAWTYLKGE